MTWNIAATLSVPLSKIHNHHSNSADCKATTDNPQQHIMDRIMQKFPTVFDGKIRMMEGEEFHILLIEGATSICVKTTQSVP